MSDDLSTAKVTEAMSSDSVLATSKNGFTEEYLESKDWQDSQFGIFAELESRYFSAELACAKTVLSKGARVLEVGFTNGTFLAFGKVQYWDIQGVELNPALVISAQRHGFIATHTGGLDVFQDENFDLVVAFNLLEHIEQSQIFGFLRSVKRVLSKGGVFLAQFPNGDSPFGLPNQNGDITHVTSLGKGKIQYFSKALGLDLVFCGGSAQPLCLGSVTYFLHRLIALPFKALLNALINLIFFPRAPIDFYSSNLGMISSKPSKSEK
jgi:SAM-dependent methyltransferase